MCACVCVLSVCTLTGHRAERVDWALAYGASDMRRMVVVVVAVVAFSRDRGCCYGAPGQTGRHVLTCGP